MIGDNNNPRPLPGASEDATSADIHAYLGNFSNPPCLLLDSEGFMGDIPVTDIPLAAARRWNPAIAEKRREYVETAYPRYVAIKYYVSKLKLILFFFV